MAQVAPVDLVDPTDTVSMVCTGLIRMVSNERNNNDLLPTTICIPVKMDSYWLWNLHYIVLFHDW